MKLILTNHLITCAQGNVDINTIPTGILIDGEKIKRIDVLSNMTADIEKFDIEKIHLEDLYVMPGMIDAHLHLSFSASSQPVNELIHDTDDMVLLRMINAAMQELKAGVTTVRDCGSRGMSILKLRDFIRDDIIEGADIISAGMPITTTGGHCNFCGLECDSTDEVKKAVRQLCKDGVDYIKVMVSGGNMTPGSASTITQYEYDALKVIADEAHAHGKKVSGHVHTIDSIEYSIRAGFDTLEHCSFKLSDGGEKYSNELVAMMKANGIAVCPAFSKSYVVSAEEGAPQPDKIAIWDKFKQSRFQTTRAMFEEGINIIAGTDAGCKNTKFNSFWKVLPLLQQEIGMTSKEAILSCTYRSASALGVLHEIGSIEVGKHADIIALKNNPIEDLNALKSVNFVMKRGRKVAL
ncbi:MAG: amidohydrolase family protein [Clostridiales bacterium]|nr:amidohydrolase family protein [Clostridiales bacterium]